jgi:hypothetical protein
MPHNPNETISIPNMILTTMEPALPRIACIMARWLDVAGSDGLGR